MKKVFRYESPARTSNLPILSLLGLKSYKGEVGIEIEVEGNKFPKDNSNVGHPRNEYIPDTWAYHKDGSLRGNDNAEYVTRKPLKFSEVPQAVNELWQMFAAYGSVLDVSNRTSVHVHLNAQSFHLNRLCSFVALYLSVEELLTEWCGQHRVGNLFCLRAKDAPAIAEIVKVFLQDKWQGKAMNPFPDSLHYAGLNLHALSKYGSIEVRTMRGAIEPEEVIRWVEVLQHIYELSAEFTDPRDICENFSGRDVMEYARMVLGKHANTIFQDIAYNEDMIRNSLYDGIRIAQDLCYCRDWSAYVPTKLDEDPFRRPAKKVLQSMQAYTDEATVPTTPSPYTIGTGLSTTAQFINELQNNSQIWLSSPPIPTLTPAEPTGANTLQTIVEVEPEDDIIDFSDIDWDEEEL